MNSNFFKRLLSAIILFPLLIILIIKAPYLLIFILTLFCLLICWYEWCQLFEYNRFYFFFGYSILLFIFLFFNKISFFYLIYLSFFFLFIPFLFNFNREYFLVTFFPLLVGTLYLTIGFIPLLFIAKEYPREYLIYFFSVVFSADTGAYLTGKKLGRTPFFSKISPKKTLEGFIGGIVFAVLVGMTLSYFLKLWSLGISFIISVILALIEALGDLFESAVKRAVGKKDSGAIIPGHGGMLDRIDGVLFASSTFLIILKVIERWN